MLWSIGYIYEICDTRLYKILKDAECEYHTIYKSGTFPLAVQQHANVENRIIDPPRQRNTPGIVATPSNIDDISIYLWSWSCIHNPITSRQNPLAWNKMLRKKYVKNDSDLEY